MRPCSTSAIASTTSCTGSEIDPDTNIIARNPRTTATSARTITGTSIGARSEMIQPLARIRTSTTMPAPGSAEHIAHIRMSRARTPGALSASSKSNVAAIIRERKARWVTRKPVHTVAVAPNNIVEVSNTATRPPLSTFSGSITAAATTHGVSRITDWRRVMFRGLRCRGGFVSRPGSGPRRASATNAMPPTMTLTVPTTTITTVAIRFVTLSTACAPRTASPLTETMIATTSAAVRRYAKASPAAYR